MINFKKEDIFLVTGASSGIGRGIALELNELGASVIISARNKERLLETKNNAKYSENIYIEPRDLSVNIEEIPKWIKTLAQKYGKLKGLAAVAGIDIIQTLQMLEVNAIEETFKINYQAPLFCAKGFADRRNNIGEGASIVFIASIAATYPEAGQVAYAASKAALVASSYSISKELVKRKIRCNCISPAMIETAIFERHSKLVSPSLGNYKLGIGKPSDVSGLAAYLFSDRARWITGQNYILEGGGLQ